MPTTLSGAICAFDDTIDDMYPDAPFGFAASRILRTIDPIQYRQAFHNWADQAGIDTDELIWDTQLP